MSSFNEVWKSLQVNLKPGTKVKNWTAYNGYLGDSMTIMEVKENSVIVDSPRADSFQHVPRADFEAVWQVWPEYRGHKLQRSALTPITRFSKYIISIFHWYESLITRP